MAFTKPSVTKIEADISKISIYLRSTKKFGKTTLFRDVILEKYGDPQYGLLVGCGAEIGYKMLDNLNATQVTSWDDLIELKDWLINTKGVEHNIKMVAFDTGDELCLLADSKTIRISNKENPAKVVRSIKAAMGGYTAGEKYSANNLLKPLISELEMAGFGTWVIAHSKFKTIKDKGALEEDGYQQLTSNLAADYEAAFGDVMDVCLTGVVDRETETKGEGEQKKRYVTDTVRKLYFRGTPMIDAGGRFADGTVPEYMIFDKPNMAKEFIQIIEDGMKNSRIDFKKDPSKKPKVETANPVVKTRVETVESPVPADDELPFDTLEPENEVEDIDAEVKVDKATRIAQIKKKFSECTETDVKKEIKAILIASNPSGDAKLNETTPDDALSKIEVILDM